MWESFALSRRFPDMRRAERLSVANALASLATADLRFLTTLKLHWEDADPHDELFRLASLVDHESGRDELSAALRGLSRLPSLRSLELTGCHILGREMFQDPDPSATDPVPEWPALMYLTLRLSGTTPEGRWYFSGDASSLAQPPWSDSPESEWVDTDPSDSHSDQGHPWIDDDGTDWYRKFRSTPDSTTLTPLILSMTRAVARMPVLRRLELVVGSAYILPGIEAYYFCAAEPDTRKAHFVKRDELAFHATHLAKARWVLSLRNLDPEWSLPPSWRAALAKVSSPECVFVIDPEP